MRLAISRLWNATKLLITKLLIAELLTSKLLIAKLLASKLLIAKLLTSKLLIAKLLVVKTLLCIKWTQFAEAWLAGKALSKSPK